MGILLKGNLSCFPWGKTAMKELRYPTYSAFCFLCARFHNPLNTDMDYRILNIRV